MAGGVSHSLHLRQVLLAALPNGWRIDVLFHFSTNVRQLNSWQITFIASIKCVTNINCQLIKASLWTFPILLKTSVQMCWTIFNLLNQIFDESMLLKFFFFSLDLLHVHLGKVLAIPNIHSDCSIIHRVHWIQCHMHVSLMCWIQ